MNRSGQLQQREQEGGDGGGFPQGGFSWREMDEHIDKKLQPIHDKLDALTDLIKSGFPGGDPVGHCHAHETMIEDAKASKDMWSKVKTSLVEKSIWAVFVGIVMAAWFWIRGNVR